MLHNVCILVNLTLTELHQWDTDCERWTGKCVGEHSHGQFDGIIPTFT